MLGKGEKKRTHTIMENMLPINTSRLTNLLVMKNYSNSAMTECPSPRASDVNHCVIAACHLQSDNFIFPDGMAGIA